MKEKIVIDLGKIMDEVFDAAEELRDAVRDGLKGTAEKGEKIFRWDESVDFYPAYSYPPVNAYMTEKNDLIFEFALAGFEDTSIDLEFSGDYMMFSVDIAEDFKGEKKNVRYFKHRLRLKEIDRQKYYVPADKFDQGKTNATYSHGILVVEIPPRDEKKPKQKVKVNVKKNA